MFERILVALKFAPASEYALAKGAQLAKVHGAALHILHVMDYGFQEADGEDPQLVACRQEVEDNFDQKVRPLVGDLDRVHFDCRPADPAMEVCRTAKEIKADLIVLGCHQLLEKMCLGRIDYVGMTILEKAPCPVLLVPYCD